MTVPAMTVQPFRGLVRLEHACMAVFTSVMEGQEHLSMVPSGSGRVWSGMVDSYIQCWLWHGLNVGESDTSARSQCATWEKWLGCTWCLASMSACPVLPDGVGCLAGGVAAAAAQR